MLNSLIDAGPFIALFDKDDGYHNAVMKFIGEYSGNLITTWPVITEASHMLDFNINVQIDFIKWLQMEAVQIVNLENKHLELLIRLAEKYSDLPMDIADGSLLVVSELTGIKNIITIDSDYHIYRISGNKTLKNLLEPYLKSM
jgi:uncharacterized protein